VRIKACHLAVGVDLEGRKRVLGMWIEQTEGARFWLGVLTELRNRGVRDVLIVCCDCEDHVRRPGLGPDPRCD
jgi:putative transposase